MAMMMFKIPEQCDRYYQSFITTHWPASPTLVDTLSHLIQIEPPASFQNEA